MFMNSCKISPVELVKKLSTEAGWICTGGEEVGRIPHDESNILGVSSFDNLVTFEFRDRAERVTVTGDDIVLVEPWIIQVNQNYPRRQQKKAEDGGGWHNVLVPVAAVRLRNKEIQRVVVEERKQERKDSN